MNDSKLPKPATSPASPWLDDYRAYPVIQPRKIHYMPHRAGAFGNAEFKHPTTDLDGPSTFDVLGWADENKRRCSKRKAKYAFVRTCLTPALMLLSSNAEVSEAADKKR